MMAMHVKIVVLYVRTKLMIPKRQNVSFAVRKLHTAGLLQTVLKHVNVLFAVWYVITNIMKLMVAVCFVVHM
jgi:hypothetical protein